MKKTLLITLALVAILGAAFVFYQQYSEQYDPSKLTPSGIYSEMQENTDNNQTNSSTDGNSTANASSESETIAAMDFTVYNQKGEAVQLSNYFGKPIVVNFWATWCTPCTSELPGFENLYQTYGDSIEFLMVNLTDGAQETINNVSSFIKENAYTFPVYYDTDMDAAITYSVYSIPSTLFIDADGNIVASHKGSMSESTLKNYMENLLALGGE